jgi:hypothetical protein
MARLPLFSSADVVAILGLTDAEAVQRLVRADVLAVAAYTPRGHPLYTAAAVVRAAKRIRPKRDEPEQSRR